MATTLHDPRYRELIRMLVEARKDAGLSQEAASAKLDRPQSFLGKVETYQRRLDALELFDLLGALGVDAGEFASEAQMRVAPVSRGRRRK